MYDWTYGSSTPEITQSAIGVAAATMPADALLTAVYSATAGAFIAAAEDGGQPEQLTRIIRTFTNDRTATLRWYVARVSSTDYLWGRCENVPAGDYTASVFRIVGAGGVVSMLAQVESGSVATSPIVTAAGRTGIRLAQSVTIPTAGASFITINFDNGSPSIYRTPDDLFTIPFSKYNWGTRYITRIDYGVF